MNIKNISFDQQKVIINGCVKFWIEDEHAKVEFDRNRIDENNVIPLIDEYLKLIFKK